MWGKTQPASKFTFECERLRAKPSGGKESSEEVPRKCFAARLGVHGVALQREPVRKLGCCVKFSQPLEKTGMAFERGNSCFDHGGRG